MKIQLSEHFTVSKLIRIALPSIIMMAFTSIYVIVDGYFVSNFAGKTAFAAVNYIYPLIMILGSVGFMFGTGGSALISKTLGEGDSDRANRRFSLIVYSSIAAGLALVILGLILLRPVACLMGAEGSLLEESILYGRILIIAVPTYILQYEFQCLFPAAGKPELGLYITIAAAVTNMVLDWLFIAVFPWGLTGAAAATAISQFVGGILPIIYFARDNSSFFRFCRTEFEPGAVLKTCTNGISELISNISFSFVSMLYNVQLLRYAGEDGIAAFGVLMYVCLVFQAVFMGYSVGTAPVTGYNLGAGNKDELKGVFIRSVCIVSVCAVFMFAAGFFLARPLSAIFTGYDAVLLEMTVHAFKIFSFSFLFCGLVIFGSSFFTALNNGLVSGAISFLRAMLFEIAAVLILPLVFGLDGIWMSTVAAEIMAAVVTVILLKINRKKYGYI